MVGGMSEQGDVIGDLEAAGVLGGIRWAWAATVRQVLGDYSAATGHTQGWLGYSAYTIFSDRLDRVFSAGPYALAEDANPDSGLDVVHDGLVQADITTMPVLEPDLVRRADLNNSPGWAWGEWRWLLASCIYGKSGTIPWQQKSETKQRVAQQPSPDELTLFDKLEVPGVPLPSSSTTAAGAPLKTLVVAHAIDMATLANELYLGRPRINVDHGPAWYWKEDLLLVSPAPGGRRSPVGVNLTESGSQAPDAPVRLRRKSAGEGRSVSGGEK
jgi:hypothetical protein